MTTPSEFGRRLVTLTDSKSLDAIGHAMGAAAKKAAADAVTADLGIDQRMSGIRSKAKLGAGYDLEDDGVMVHLRPKGLWILADRGRRRQGTIYPRRRGGKKALRIGTEIRATSHYSMSRGLGTIDDAIELMNKDVPIAASKAMAINIGAL